LQNIKSPFLQAQADIYFLRLAKWAVPSHFYIFFFVGDINYPENINSFTAKKRFEV
jgi:hypothetical protein